MLEYQVARHPLWHALAACAFQPMLGALRTRPRRLDEEDRDQALQAALIEGLGRLRLPRDAASGFPLRRIAEKQATHATSQSIAACKLVAPWDSAVHVAGKGWNAGSGRISS